MAVRRALAVCHSSQTNGPQRKSNLEIRLDLERLAKNVDASWLELFECDEATDARLLDHAFDNWRSDLEAEFGDGFASGEAQDYRRYKAVITELEWLARFMRSAADATPIQRGPWRSSEQKQMKILRGQFLAPVYEAAFGEAVSANNFPHDARHTNATPFMTFYLRVVKLTFDENGETNLADIVKAACRLHRINPVQLAEGTIPGL